MQNPNFVVSWGKIYNTFQSICVLQGINVAYENARGDMKEQSAILLVHSTKLYGRKLQSF
jgi:hypothetical protein